MANNFTINVSPPPNRGVGGRADLNGGIFKDLTAQALRVSSIAQESYDRDAAFKETVAGTQYIPEAEKTAAKERAAEEAKAELQEAEDRKNARETIGKIASALQEALEVEAAQAQEQDLKDLIALVAETTSSIAETNRLLAEMISEAYAEA